MSDEGHHDQHGRYIPPRAYPTAPEWASREIDRLRSELANALVGLTLTEEARQTLSLHSDEEAKGRNEAIARAERAEAECKAMREALEDAVDTLEAMNLHIDNPLYDRLRSALEKHLAALNPSPAGREG